MRFLARARLASRAAFAAALLFAAATIAAAQVIPSVRLITFPPLPLHIAESIIHHYKAGDYVMFATMLRDVRDFRTLVDVVQKRQVSLNSRAQLVTMALEMANFSYSAYTQVSMDAGDRFIELGCEQLRKEKPSSFGRWWMIASVAVMEAAGRLNRAEDHVNHALEWIPGEASMVLARAVIEDQTTSPLSPNRRGAAEARDAVRLYELALTIPDAVPEASVRLAYLHYRAGRYDAALSLLNGARSTSPNVHVNYWTALVRGRVLEKLGRLDEAASAYRDALRIVPGAQSARVALLAMKFVQGDRAVTERLIEDVVAPGEDAHDPWWEYWQGDYRLYPKLIEILRRAWQ